MIQCQVSIRPDRVRCQSQSAVAVARNTSASHGTSASPGARAIRRVDRSEKVRRQGSDAAVVDQEPEPKNCDAA